MTNDINAFDLLILIHLNDYTNDEDFVLLHWQSFAENTSFIKHYFEIEY